MAVSIIEYDQYATTDQSTTWNGVSWTVGSWLIVIHAMSSGNISSMGGDPGSLAESEWPPGAWQLITQADAGAGMPKVRVWATQFTDSVIRDIVLLNDPTAESYQYLYYVEGTRKGADANEIFVAGAASSATPDSSQKAPLYTPDSSGLLIGAWLSGALLNYSSLGGLTARPELDGTSSTSRTGEQVLSAAGAGTRTAITSVAAPWASATIVVRPDTGASVTFPQQPLKTTIELALGANPNQDPAYWAGLWTDVTDYAYTRDKIQITRGRQDESSSANPSSMTVTLDNTDGRFTRLNPNSPYYGVLNKNTPMRLWVDAGNGPSLRYTGYVSEWPPRSQGSEIDEHMPIRVDGPLRRLAQGQVVKSSVLNAIRDRGNAFGYWPLETDGTSGLANGFDLRTSGTATFGSTNLIGSAGSVTVPFGSSMSAPVVGMPNTGSWQVSFWLDIPEGTTDVSPVVCLMVPSSNDGRWLIYANSPSNPGVVSVQTDAHIVVGQTDIRGVGPTLVTVWAWQDGGNIGVEVILNNRFDNNGSFGGNTLGPITAMGINNTTFTGIFVFSGQVSHLYASASDPALTDSQFTFARTWLPDAGSGHVGERACDRIRRISSESGIPVPIIGDDGASALMGPQPVQDFVSVLRDCEATDGGVLYELRDGRLSYQARAARYNRDPDLILDYPSGHLSPPLEPTDDDQHLLNDFTATRANGGSARVFDQNHIDTVGLYPDSTAINVFDDDQLLDQAGWRVHLGTADGLRFPSISPNLILNPELIPDWSTLDVGQTTALVNPGRDLPPGQINVFVEGYSEKIDTVSWTATANCSPGDPWKIGVVDDPLLAHVDTDGSVLAASLSTPGTAPATLSEDFEDATLSVTVTNGGNASWARSSDTAHTGAWSFKAGTITDNQTTDAVVTVPAGYKTLMFWYKVSSEYTFDFLRVLVDGVEKAKFSGELPWTQCAVNVAGASTVTFRYSKDAFTASGTDTAYIDDLLFTTPETMTVSTTTGPGWTTSPGDTTFDVSVGGERVTTTQVTPFLTDTFTRTTSSGWGSADSGNAWTTQGPASASNYSVSGGFGRHSLAVVNQNMFSVTPNPSPYFDIRAEVASSQLATGSDQILYLVGRFVDVNNYYMANVGLSTSRAVILTIRSNVAGTETHLAGDVVPGLTHAANTRFSVRFRGDGSLLRAKVWLAGSPEPDAWFVTVTNTALAGAGSVGFRSLLTGGYTGTLPVVATYDNVSVTNPQTMSVIRSVNGVIKSHSAGEDVRLAQPSIVSL